LEGAKHINSGEGGHEVFLECGNGALGGICSMVVRGDELDVDCFGPDVGVVHGNVGQNVTPHNPSLGLFLYHFLHTISS
jgi:hypothetical protein